MVGVYFFAVNLLYAPVAHIEHTGGVLCVLVLCCVVRLDWSVNDSPVLGDPHNLDVAVRLESVLHIVEAVLTALAIRDVLLC